MLCNQTLQIEEGSTLTSSQQIAASEKQFVVFPNPVASDFIYIKNNKQTIPTTIRLYHSNGQLIFTQKLTLKNGLTNLNLPSTLKNGIYTLSIESPHISQNEQIIIIR